MRSAVADRRKAGAGSGVNGIRGRGWAGPAGVAGSCFDFQETGSGGCALDPEEKVMRLGVARSTDQASRRLAVLTVLGSWHGPSAAAGFDRSGGREM